MDAPNSKPKPTLVLSIIDTVSMRMTIDLARTPGLDYAINMLEQALRKLKNEQANAESMAFAQRIAQEQMEQQAMSAMTTGRKQ